MAEALESGHLFGVAVDVLEGEEHGDISRSPLLASARAGRNVLITPHIGGATRESIACTETAADRTLLGGAQSRRGDGGVTLSG